ncbi:hypothetical protein H5T52_06120 [Candidatus Bipolaricaulota bacterium]|nr:hypothetical protein [Candidatus Bipolaricaulota bacterium]
MRWRVSWHREVGSTNDLAKDAPFWTAVVAERQTAGRGRQGRLWHSPAGGLWLSAVVPPPVPAQGTIALEVARALASGYSLPVAYEPPNDLVLFGRKLGGILVEVCFQGGRPVKGVVGVGNQREQLSAGVSTPAFRTGHRPGGRPGEAAGAAPAFRGGALGAGGGV